MWQIIDFCIKILHNILLSPFIPFNTRQKRYNNLYMAIFTSFEDLGKDKKDTQNGLENPQVGGGGGGRKKEKEDISVSQERIRTERAKEIWNTMKSAEKKKISDQFKMFSGAAKKTAIYNWIISEIDQAGNNFSSERKDHQSVEDLIVELDEKNPTPRSAALKKLGYSREDLAPEKYTMEVIDQIVANKIKKGNPIPLLEEREEKRIFREQKNKELKNLGYTPENSQDMSQADLNWAIKTQTVHGIPLPPRISGVTREIAENLGSREFLLKESQKLLEKMKTFDGSLEDAKKLIDEYYELYTELEGVNNIIHEWTVGKQKEKYEKIHKVVEPPTNLPTE